jgi:uncharacterized protein YndB with AHSA1/START domain
MEKIRKSIRIAAPAASVYEQIAVPENLVAIWPGLVEVKNVKLGTTGAESFDWTYKMAGMRFHGQSKRLQAEPGRRLVTHNERGIPSTFRWTFDALDAGTEATVEIEYEIPVPLLGKFAAPFIRRLNERELETLLGNLKERLEAGEQRPGEGEPRARPAPPPTQPHA